MPQVEVRRISDGGYSVVVRGILKGKRERRHEKASGKAEAKQAVKDLLAQWDTDKNGGGPS